MQHCNEEIQSPSMLVSITSSAGWGTGFFVRENLIATNIHCVAGATSVWVKLLDTNTKYSVEGVVAFDDKNDLAILKVSGIGAPFPIGNSNMIKKGEPVKAVGCIDGEYVAKKGEFHSSVNNGQWLQTTARTKNGYSGGPLLDGKGLVIGVNFGDGDYSGAISSNILKQLVVQTRSIESLDQWQKRETICAYDYLVQSKTKDYANAIVDLDKVIQLNPEIILAHFNRGTLRQNLAQCDSEEDNLVDRQQLIWSSVDDFTQTINLCPDYAPAYNNRGLSKSHIGKSKTGKDNLVDRQQLIWSSVDDFTQTINLCPDYAPAYNNRADTKLHLAKSENMETSQVLYHDAITDINSAIAKHANNSIEENTDIALFHHTRGEIKEAIGDLSGAKNDFEKAMTNSEYTNDSTISDDLRRVKDKLKHQELAI